MPETNKPLLLIGDYQLGFGDQAYAKESALQAVAALVAARKAGLLVVFSKVCFQPGYVDISPRNKAFAVVKTKNMLPPEASQLLPAFKPLPNEVVVNKDRFSAFSGNDLRTILRSQEITQLVIAGVTTSGVVLSTFCEAADQDLQITILSDACADPKQGLHHELMTSLFPRSADVVTVKTWSDSLPG